MSSDAQAQSLTEENEITYIIFLKTCTNCMRNCHQERHTPNKIFIK